MKQIVASDPFIFMDSKGVGKMIRLAAKKAREANPNIKVKTQVYFIVCNNLLPIQTGLCVAGELSQDFTAIKFAHKERMDYICCPPYDIPIIKVAAAQAQIQEDQRKLAYKLEHEYF